MSAGSGHAPDQEREKKKHRKSHDSKKDKRRSTRGRTSEDSNSGKTLSRENSSTLPTAEPIPPAAPVAPAVDPVAHLHPLLWTEADVALWLQYIGEGGLTSCFDVINGVLLINLDEEQLTNLGVTNVASRKKLMVAIKEVKERSQKVNIKVTAAPLTCMLVTDRTGRS